VSHFCPDVQYEDRLYLVVSVQQTTQVTIFLESIYKAKGKGLCALKRKALIKSAQNVYHSVPFIICTFITCHHLYRFILSLHPEASAKLEIPFLPHYRHCWNPTWDAPLESQEYKQMRQMISWKVSWPRKW